MPSFMDSGTAEKGFQGKDKNAPPPSHLEWKAYFLRIFLGKQTETVEVRQACQSQGHPQVSWFYLNQVL